MSLLVIDTPAGIAAYRLLAIRSALKLEVIGLQMSRGVRASVLARAELAKAGKAAPKSKAALSEAYALHLVSLGILPAQS